MSRQGKDPVHKCHSDPGGGAGGDPVGTYGTGTTSAGRISRMPNIQSVPITQTTRKCVLTLDGYSYVIGEFGISEVMMRRISSSSFYAHGRYR